MKRALIFSMVLLVASSAFARNSYIGYSGAPGSRGTCAVTCHYRDNFDPSITITGFPEFYEPVQQYTVTIGHTQGSSISQFNGSIRIGNGSENGGIISAGTNTVIYSHAQETNGVKWSSNYTDSGTFIWTAPDAGTGEVRLYYAGLQGSLGNGASHDTVLISNEFTTDVKNTHTLPSGFFLGQNYPNPFNNETVIQIYTPNSGKIRLEIANLLGQRVFEYNRLVTGPETVNITWDGRYSDGNDLPSGVYFYRLSTENGSLTRKMLLLR
ncbi:MAG: T9SS type A sorting domain-containing protein [Candidatus Zixiibacteriota bacterium]|nr:MAG: T9SS type A sorting domain-containing protein [candidate division Zixibacteria bacterium]